MVIPAVIPHDMLVTTSQRPHRNPSIMSHSPAETLKSLPCNDPMNFS